MGTTTDKIYRETLANLTVALTNHECPDGRASLRAFCQTYGFNRPNLCQVLKGTSGHDLSVGLYLKLVDLLGLLPPGCSAPPNTAHTNTMSLRHYMEVDATAVQRSILALEYS